MVRPSRSIGSPYTRLTVIASRASLSISVTFIGATSASVWRSSLGRCPVMVELAVLGWPMRPRLHLHHGVVDAVMIHQRQVRGGIEGLRTEYPGTGPGAVGQQLHGQHRV